MLVGVQTVQPSRWRCGNIREKERRGKQEGKKEGRERGGREKERKSNVASDPSSAALSL